MTITKFKSKANFGEMENFVTKFNFRVLEIRDRRGHTNDKWSNYELRSLSFRNYGNSGQASNHFPNGSAIDMMD